MGLQRDQKIFADTFSQIIDSLEELGQILVQTAGQYVFNASVAQLGAQQPARRSVSLDRLLRYHLWIDRHFV